MFWDKKQILINKRLEEDYKRYSSITFLKKTKPKDERVTHCVKLKQQYSAIKCKHKQDKALIKIQLRNILDDIIDQDLKNQREYYENNYEQVLIYKREKRKSEFIKASLKKWKDYSIEKVLPPF